MRVDDKWYSTQDLTVDECCAVEALLGETWATIAPARSSTHARALFTQLISRSKDLEEAQKIVGSWTVAEITERLKITEGDDRPVEYADGVPVVSPKRERAGSATT